jgi:lipopolysaccharide transport system ATP-binding protein
VIALDYEAAGITGPLPELVEPRSRFYDGLGSDALQLFERAGDSLDPIDLPPSGTLRCADSTTAAQPRIKYVLTLFLEVNREVEDWITRTRIELDVVDGDFYGTGRLYPDGWRGKGVLVPHDWIIPE